MSVLNISFACSNCGRQRSPEEVLEGQWCGCGKGQFVDPSCLWKRTVGTRRGRAAGGENGVVGSDSLDSAEAGHAGADTPRQSATASPAADLLREADALDDYANEVSSPND